LTGWRGWTGYQKKDVRVKNRKKRLHRCTGFTGYQKKDNYTSDPEKIFLQD